MSAENVSSGWWWMNAQVINTEILDSFSESIWYWLLSFPDLSTWILWPLNPVMLSISIVVWLFVLWIFILSKASPDLFSQMTKLPWWWWLSHLKWKNWWEFFLQYAVISMIVYIFLWFSQWWTESRDNIKNFFTWWNEVGQNDKNNKLNWSSKNWMVTITIKPLEWIRVTWVRFDSEWNKDKNTINNSTSKSVIDSENSPKCNYNRIERPDTLEWIKNNYQDCVYPQAKQWMLIVDSFSIQWNVEKLNPVNIYVTNDFDWVDLRNSPNWKIWQYDSKRSVTKQNETHSIISILRNNENVFKEAWTDNSFINYLRNSIETISNTSIEALRKSDLWNTVWHAESLKSWMIWVYENLFEVRKRIINWENSENIISLLNQIKSTEMTFIWFNRWNFDQRENNYHTILQMISEHDYYSNHIKRVVWDIWENSSYSKSWWSFWLWYYINDYHNSANSIDNWWHWFQFRLWDMMNNYKSAMWNWHWIVTIDDLIISVTNKESNQKILKDINDLIWIWDNAWNQFLTVVDQFYWALTTSWATNFWIVWSWETETKMKEYYDLWSWITSLILWMFDYTENKTIRRTEWYPYRPILALSIMSNVDLSKWFMESLRLMSENEKGFLSSNMDMIQNLTVDWWWIWKRTFNQIASSNILKVVAFSSRWISTTFSPEIEHNQKFLLESLKRVFLSVLEDKETLKKDKSNPEVVYFNDWFISQFLYSWYYKATQVLWYGYWFEDIVNSVSSDWKTMKYRWPHNWKADDSKKYWVWNNEKRIEEANKSIFAKALWWVLWWLFWWEQDVTYVWVEWWQWIEVRKWDIIFWSPWTTIYALPYPIELMMSKELAETIEFVDDKWWSLWFYSDRYDNDKKLISKWIWKDKEVWKLTWWWLYWTIMKWLDETWESINWLFNPIIWYWVVESWFWATILLIFTLLLVWFAYAFFIFKNIALYLLTFIFFILFIWLFLLDWQPKRVAKKVLAWFVSLALIPLWWYLVMFVLYKAFWDDQSYLYWLRNFSVLSSILIACIVAYVPIMIFLWTRKFLFSLIVDWKFDKNALSVWQFFWAWTWIWALERLWKWADNLVDKAKEKLNQWKDKLAEKAWLKKNTMNVSTTWSLWDWMNDTSNNELINQLAEKKEANEFNVEKVNDENKWTMFHKSEFTNKKQQQAQQIAWSKIFNNKKDKVTKWAKLIANWQTWNLTNLQNNWVNPNIISNNTQWKDQMISWVTPDLINSISFLRNSLKEEWKTDSDVLRMLIAMFENQKDLLVSLTKSLQEVKEKSTDPNIKWKLYDADHTLTAKDLEIIKAIKEKKNIRWEFSQEEIRKELSSTIDKMKKWKFENDDLDKIKALRTFNNVLYNNDKEEKFFAMTDSIQWILAWMKNRPSHTVEKEITKFIMNWDQNGLNNYKQQNAHIEWLDVLIDRIQTMPHEMMKVLNSNATAAEMRNNAAWINEFIWLMKNSQQLEAMKHQDMNKYLATMLQIQEFKSSSIEEKMNMASMASVQSIASIKEANKVTTMLSNEISRMMQSQWAVSQHSITNIVQNIAWTTEISVRDQRDLANKLKENLNQIRETNRISL